MEYFNPLVIHLSIQVPVRATNTQHLRDGFTRFLLQRMRDQSEHMSEEEEREIMKAIQEFKSNFPAAKVKKDTEFVFTKTRDGGLKIEFEVRLYHSSYEHELNVRIWM